MRQDFDTWCIYDLSAILVNAHLSQSSVNKGKEINLNTADLISTMDLP